MYDVVYKYSISVKCIAIFWIDYIDTYRTNWLFFPFDLPSQKRREEENEKVIAKLVFDFFKSQKCSPKNDIKSNFVRTC